MKSLLAMLAIAFGIPVWAQPHLPAGLPPGRVRIQRFPVGPELHLKNIRQLTFGGVNTSLALSPDGRSLAFEHRDTIPGACPEIEIIPLSGGAPRTVLRGASHPAWLGSSLFCIAGNIPSECTAFTDTSWPTPNEASLVLVNAKGSVLRRFDGDSITDVSVSPDGSRIAFISMHSDGTELLTMARDGSNRRELTFFHGYIGSPHFSKGGRQILFSASRLVDEEVPGFLHDRAQGFYHPKGVELWMIDTDGTNLHGLTGMMRVCGEPCTGPDSLIVFGSNYNTLVPNDMSNPARELFWRTWSGTGFGQVTFSGGYNGFPIFTADGTHLIFASNRSQPHSKAIDLFFADWVP